jgi:hypothetical protein
MGLPYFVACSPRLMRHDLSKPHDIETYVYFSQFPNDHYIISWTVSNFWCLRVAFDEFVL